MIRGFNKNITISDIANVFKVDGVSSNWLSAISVGYSKIYDDRVIVCYRVESGITILGAYAYNDVEFPFRAKYDVISLLKKSNKAILSSYRIDGATKRYAEANGYVYVKEQNFYAKGF